ncbi:hypothetical protein SteCoe_37343 [Stentor coeruleus]|uniref:Endonuclease/exonuclease/phosphatase domain-containing protein n=1 Tax=Stentor coeruleus TaxID=5963 RepID=A0A1R2ANF6_9CILI|nr:hypothetical protein SteCoe_37343 [Stentor coeruleus]
MGSYFSSTQTVDIPNTEIPLSNPKSLTQFSVLTYNILANSYSSYMNHCPKKYLNFDYRSSLIFKQIQDINADFVCLQEVDKYENYFKPFLKKHGYKSHWKKRPSSWSPDGSLIAWKEDIWELVEIKEIDFNEESMNRRNSAYRKNNIGIIIVFKHKETNSGIIIGTAHFYWDPDLEYVKFFQGTVFKTIGFTIKSKYSLPIILCGDFNCMPESKTIKYLTNQEIELNPGVEIDNEILSIPKPQEFVLKSAYACYNQEGYPKFTNYTPDFKECIDYIMYSEGVNVEELGKVLDLEDLRGVCGLPNEKYPSDHLPLAARFSGSD